MSDAILRLSEALEGRYRVESELGEGGMATVYLADDVKHERKVALKVLKPNVAAVIGAERFLAEIKTTANLQHPHIMPLFDSGEADSFLYYVMPYVEGESLRQRLDREQHLPIDDAVQIAIEVAGALDYAHAHGVLHRDVKPANVLMSEGVPVLADFGIALAFEEANPDERSQGGYDVGTLSYMSPEQITGDVELDGRSDLYSLACVLYELLTGEPPHMASTSHGIVAKRITVPAVPIRVLRAEVPQQVDDTLRRALAIGPDDRFGSASGFAKQLLSAPKGSAREGGSTVARVNASAGTGIVVLPVTNLSRAGANDYFCDGLAAEMTYVLGHVRGLRVVPRASAFAMARPRMRVRDLVRELDVSHALEGDARFEGDRYRVNVSLIEGEGERRVWGEQFDGVLASADIFQLQDRIAQEVLAALPVSLSLPDPGGRPTPEAYNLYLRARHAWFTRTMPNLTDAIRLFERAVEKDPTYARAYAGMADVYNVLGGLDYSIRPPVEVYPNAYAAAKRACELQPTLGEAHAALGNYLMSYAWEWREAGECFTKALKLNPGYSSARQWYSNYLMYTGRGEEALDEARKALEHDPRSVFLSSSLARHLMFMRRPDEAVEQFHEALKIDPDFTGALMGLALAELQAGRPEECLKRVEGMAERADPPSPLLQAIHAYAAGFTGDGEQARVLLTSLVEMPGRYVPPEFVCLVYVGLGEHERALDWLEKALAARSQALSQLKVEPLLDPLRGNSRFRKILTAVGS